MIRSYSRRTAFIAVAALAALTTPTAVHAQSGSWIGVATGNWGAAGNWQGGVIANGANNTATFGNAIPAPVTVTLDTSRTIGNLAFSNTTNFGWTIGGSSTLTLNNAGGSTISVDNPNVSATLAVQLAGAGFTKTGPGTLIASDINTMTGPISVGAGVFSVTRTATVNPLGTNAVNLTGGTLRVGFVAISPFATTGGYNADVVRSVTDPTTAATFFGTTGAVDAPVGFGFYENGIAGAVVPTGGLPGGDRSFVSAQNSAVTFQLQPYGSEAGGNVNNSMLLPNTGDAATVTLVTPQQFRTLAVTHITGSGTSRYSMRLTFSDATTSLYDNAGAGFLSNDWFGGTPFALSSLNRFNRADGSFADNGTNPRLYETDINLTAADQLKTVTGITFTKISGAFLNVMGVSGFGGTTAVQNFGANAVNVTADSTIDLAAPDGAATLGNLTIGTNTLSIVSTAGGTLTLGTGTFSGNPTFNTAAGATLALGALSGGGVARTITKSGDGGLTLTAASPGMTAGSSLVVTGGVVNLNNATAIGANPLVTVNAGNLSLGAGTNPTFNSLAGAASGAVTLNGNTLTLGAGTATFGGAITNGSGAGALIKTGAGTQTLAGPSTFTGGVTVNAGTLVSTAAGRLGTGAVNLTGGTLVVGGGAAQVSLAGFGGAGTGFTINGNATVAADVATLTPALGGQAGSVFANTPVPTTAFTASFTYNASLGSGNPADGATVTFHNDPRGAAALGDGGGSIGYGGINPITPSGAFAINIYNPNTRGVKVTANGVTAGAYTPVTPVELYNTQVAVTLTYDGANLSVTLNDGTNNAVFGPVPVNLPAIAGGATAFLGFTGGTGGEFAQQTISNFTYQTPNLSVYTNAVNVAAAQTGTINVIATTAVPTVTMGALNLAAGANLTVGADASTPANQSYGLTFGAVTLAGTHTVTVANNGTGTGTVAFGAVSGTGPLVKAGAGTLTLTGAGTYTGATTVNAGRLFVTNTTGSATGTGAVTVNAGGLLGGTGNVGGNVTVAGGTIAPGVSPGRLSIGGNLTFTGGSLVMELNGTTAGTLYDQLAVTGALALGSNVTTLVTSLGYTPAAADTLTIVTAGSGGNAGTFVGLPNGASFLVGTFGGTPYTATIQYNPTSIVLTGFTPVPEPAHILLIGAGVAGLWRWRKRRTSALAA